MRSDGREGGKDGAEGLGSRPFPAIAFAAILQESRGDLTYEETESDDATRDADLPPGKAGRGTSEAQVRQGG